MCARYMSRDYKDSRQPSAVSRQPSAVSRQPSPFANANLSFEIEPNTQINTLLSSSSKLNVNYMVMISFLIRRRARLLKNKKQHAQCFSCTLEH